MLVRSPPPLPMSEFSFNFINDILRRPCFRFSLPLSSKNECLNYACITNPLLFGFVMDLVYI